MKAYGYRRIVSDDEGSSDKQIDEELIELGEVSLAAKTPEELRTVARFLLHAADLLENHGGDFGHEHLQDWLTGWSADEWVDVIACRGSRK